MGKFISAINKIKEDAGFMNKSASSSVSYEISQSKPTAEELASRMRFLYENIESLIKPTVVSSNFLTLFNTIPEVFWPIDFIASRISEAHYDLKRTKDDSIVWCSRQNVDTILKRPNPVMSWRELVYQHFVYKLATGNAFLRASMPAGYGPDTLICQWCDNYWQLPANLVTVIPQQIAGQTPIFGIAKKEEVIKGYNLAYGPYSVLTIPYYQIWHDRDGVPQWETSNVFLKSKSRLEALKKPIANLIAVYEARNVIYVKRGGLGFIVASKEDATGTVAVEPEEKEEILKEINRSYGLGEGQMPYGFSSLPLSFIRTNLSISDLQPFDETLEDAVKIAGAYRIPAVLVPRKDQSTFSNQDTAEKSVYESTIIPMAKRFCEELTAFLGLEQKGFYIDCDFSEVACLQTGRKEREQTFGLILDNSLKQFNMGLCTLDDIRGRLHEEALVDRLPFFGKLKFEMTPEELEKVNSIINNITTSKKGEDDDRREEKPSVRDEGD